MTIPNIITFPQWNALKQFANLTKGFTKFDPEELDNICVFYDADMNFLDYLERRDIEEIFPDYVLVPRFFWDQHQETIPHEFIEGLELPERIKEIKEHENGYYFNFESRRLADIHPMICNAIPREEQIPVIAFFTELMQANKKIRGVLQAPPGSGKTLMSTMITSNFRSRSLIVVPNEVLQDQWIDVILQFSDLTKDDIGIIQGSDLGKVEPEVHLDKKIMIVKIQSLYSQIKRNKFHELQTMYKHIDMVFYDECHNSGAATSYAKTSSIFMTPNIIGLSATPYRVGLNDYLLKVSIGETIYKLNHNNLTPDIEIHNVYVKFSPDNINRLRGLAHDYPMFLGVFGSMMKPQKEYFEYLADVTAWNLSQGHNIVLLFPTIALMENLMLSLENRHPEAFEKALLLKGKTKQDSLDMVKEERKLLMASYKIYKEEQDIRVKDKLIKRKEATAFIKEERRKIDQRLDYLKEHAIDLYKERINQAEIIVSNYNLLSAGFDKSSLSNIIFGGAPRIGKISVIQSIGRITRKHDGKLHPLVQYFVPSPFIDFKATTGIILSRNIKVQYEDAKFKYIGFKK